MKIKRISFLVCFLLLGLVETWADGHPGSEADLAGLQGEWTMVSGEREGQSLPSSSVTEFKRVAKGNETTVTLAGQVFMKANFTLDPSKSPKTIDYKITGGPHQGDTQLGIYKLEVNTVEFCFAISGHERPESFTTKSDDGRTLSVWKRAKKQNDGNQFP